MKRWLVVFTLGVACVAGLSARQTRTKALDIYLVDMEGGKATLFIAPSGETVLIDAGNPVARDTDRLMAAIQHAGVKQIDHLVTTHYHVDHVGGIPELAKRIPVRHFVDHGPTVETREQVGGYQQTYASLYSAAKHTIVKAGVRLPVAGLDWRFVMSAGRALKSPLPGAGQTTPGCAEFAKRNTPNDENGQSVGSVVTYGQFKLVDLGDLVWNNEYDLVCPRNVVGSVDVYIATHHGMDAAGSPLLVHALRPRVAVMQNGTRKGGTVQTYRTLRSSPGFEDIWQLHWSYNGMIEHNPAGSFIANVDDLPTIAGVLTAPPPAPRGSGATPTAAPPPATAPATPSAAPVLTTTPAAAAPAPPPQGGGGRGATAALAAHTPAYWIKIAAEANGTFTVSNSRNDFSKTYVKR